VRAIGGAVDRVDDDGHVGVRASGPARFLAEHAHAGGVQHGQDGGVGHEVDVVLPRSLGAVPPLTGAERRERAALRGGRDVEEVEDVVGRHPDAASTVTTAL
jgi:hypothetical protein